jgi:hypothetical protein
MKDTHPTSARRPARSALALPTFAAALIAAALAGTAFADKPQTLDEVMRTRPTTGSRVLPEPAQLEASAGDSAAAQLAETWGIEVASIRLTAHEHMIDYRYRVLDAAKADQLFKRQIKPQLIHQETGRVLVVPDTAKVGPLRNSNTPQEGRIYWMFFGNAENLVKAGDKVTVLIGDFVVEDLVVE